MRPWKTVVLIVVALVIAVAAGFGTWAFFTTPSEADVDAKFDVVNKKLAGVSKAVGENSGLIDVHASRLNAVEDGVEEIVKKSNIEFGNVRDYIAAINSDLSSVHSGLATTQGDLELLTNTVVTTINRVEKLEHRLSYRAACKPCDKDPMCVSEADCKGEGKAKKCYKRVPFTPVSKADVEALREEMGNEMYDHQRRMHKVPSATTPTAIPHSSADPARPATIVLSVPRGADVEVND